MSTLPPQNVVEALQAGNHYLLVGHVDPDLDSTGSVLALQRVLDSLGKQSICVTPNPLPEQLSFLPGTHRLMLPSEIGDSRWDHLVVLDCDVQRTGKVADWADQAESIINIDHHATNSNSCTHAWIDSAFAATAHMVAMLADALHVEIDKTTATLLYAGLAGDTGSFRFSNTTPEVLQLAGRLLAAGVDLESLNDQMYNQYSIVSLRLLAKMLDTIQTAADAKVAYACIEQRMLRAVGATPHDTDGFIQYIRMIRGIDVAILFHETDENTVRIQFRSSSNVSVARIAEFFGGGGHERAAGATLQGPIADVKQRVLQHVHRVMQTGEGE